MSSTMRKIALVALLAIVQFTSAAYNLAENPAFANLFKSRPSVETGLAYTNVTAARLYETYLSQEHPVIIDVREVDEFTAGHLPEGINVPLSTIKQDYKIIPTTGHVYVHCHSGYRSMQAVGILEGLGYRNLVNVQDGILGWIAADAPVVGGDSAITGAKLIDVYNRAAFDVMIVDVREKDEFAAGHIPSAINVPLSTLTPAVAHEILPTAGRVLYVHCQGGYRSAKFIAQLKDFGYSNFINISDGIQGWIDAGGAIVTESARKQPRTELDMALAAMGLAALPTIRHPLFL